MKNEDFSHAPDSNLSYCQLVETLPFFLTPHGLFITEFLSMLLFVLLYRQGRQKDIDDGDVSRKERWEEEHWI